MERKPPYQPQKTDLREVTRDAARCLTTVFVEPDWDSANRYKWLVFGAAILRPARDGRSDGRWKLQAHLTEGATDFEHSSGYALGLPLIGVQFESVEAHQTRLFGWVDPDDADGFHVPRPGYNPMKHPKAKMCEGGRDCRRGEKHIILPDGMWYPPIDVELYRAVRGKKVEIRIGIPHDDENL